jgi:hypothetical protein
MVFTMHLYIVQHQPVHHRPSATMTSFVSQTDMCNSLELKVMGKFF